MDELFIQQDKTDVSSENQIQLPQDMMKWPQFIIEKLYNTFQIPQGITPNFNIKASDAENFTAVGGLTLTVTPAQTGAMSNIPGQGQVQQSSDVVFPIIIERGLMYPLDIFFFEGEYKPATQDNLDRVFSQTVQYMVSSQPMQSMENDRVSSSNQYDVPVRKFAFVHELELTDNQLKEIEPVIQKHAEYFAKPQGDLKAFREDPPTVADGNTGVVQIKSTGRPNRYEVTFAKSHYLPATTTMASGPSVRATLLQMLGSKWEAGDKIRELDEVGRITLNSKPEIGAVLTNTNERFAPTDITSVGKILTPDDVILTGYCFPMVTSINGNTIPGIYMFVNECGEYTLGNSLYSKFISTINFDGIIGKKPRAGEKGVFIINAGGDEVQVSSPFKIKYVAVIEGEPLVAAEFYAGGETTFKFDRLVKRFVTLQNDDGSYTTLVPENAKYLPLVKPVVAVDSMLPLNVKALDSVGMSKMALSKDAVGYTLDLGSRRLAHMAKVAEAEFIMGVAGADLGMIKRAFDTVEKTGSATLYGKYYIDDAMGQIKKAASEASKKIKIDIPKINWIKVAEQMDEGPESVDTILSLNYAQPANISKFVQNIDMFRKCRTSLAKTVLFARISKLMDAALMRDALFALDHVVEHLENLSTNV